MGRDNVTRWSLGTAIDYTYEYDYTTDSYDANINEIIHLWQKFNTRMKVYSKRYSKLGTWNPFFYVIENGSSGNKLHIHLLARGYIKHSCEYWDKKSPLYHLDGQCFTKCVTCLWRSITGKNTNINFIQNLKKIGYIAKYTSKGALGYRFLGELYKTKLDKHDSSCKKCNSDFKLLSSSSFLDDLE